MPDISERTKIFSESVIRRMTRVANEAGAVNLSQGFPDFDPPRELSAALSVVALKGPHQYAVTWGALNFREALARKHSHFSGLDIDPQAHIVVTCGSTEAMMAALMSVTNPGDKVIVFSPFYENYGADAILTGAVPIYVPLVPPASGSAPAIDLIHFGSWILGTCATVAEVRDAFATVQVWNAQVRRLWPDDRTMPDIVKPLLDFAFPMQA